MEISPQVFFYKFNLFLVSLIQRPRAPSKLFFSTAVLQTFNPLFLILLYIATRNFQFQIFQEEVDTTVCFNDR